MGKEVKKINNAGVKYVKTVGVAKKNKVYLCICPKCGQEFEMFASGYYAHKNGCSCWIKHTHEDRLYSIYTNIKTRCYNPKTPNFNIYGGRGITMCDEWKNDFTLFKEWALENGYRDELSIDRIDYNGNYEPSNCRWADKYVQANNKRNNILFEMNGITKSLKAWCRVLGINYKTEHTAYRTHGYEEEKHRLEKKRMEIEYLESENK